MLHGHSEFDGVMLSRWRYEGGKLVRRQTQPSQDAILNRNAELQKNPDALQHLSFAGLELNIPVINLILLKKKYPALASANAVEATEAWRRFMGTAEADPFRVRSRSRARG